MMGFVIEEPVYLVVKKCLKRKPLYVTVKKLYVIVKNTHI